MQLEIRFLGREFTISESGKSIEFTTRKSFALLAYLASKPNVDISREELADLLWERSGEAQARASLRQELTNIRKTFQNITPSPLEINRLTVRFNAADIFIDIQSFKELVQSKNTRSLQKASNLYGGEFLEGFAIKADQFQNWLAQERSHYKSLALQAQLQLLTYAKENVDTDLIESTARKALSIDNTCETAHRAIMQTMYSSNRRAEALRQYQTCKNILAKELDITPSAKTKALAKKIKSISETAPVPLSKTIDNATDDSELNPKTELSTKAQKTNIHAFNSNANAPKTKNRFLNYIMMFAAVIICTGSIWGYQTLQETGISRDNPLCVLPIFQSNNNDPVKLALIAPMNKAFGRRQIWGVKRFIKDNKTNYPFKVELILKDSDGDLTKLNEILAELEQEDIASIIGPMQSRLAYEAKKWGNDHEVPVVSPSASAPYLAQPGEKDYFFRVGMSDRIRAKALAEWLRAKNLQNNPYVIHEWNPDKQDVNEPEIYGASQATALKSYLDKAQTIKFLRNNNDSIIKAAQRVKNDGRAIVIFGYTSDVKSIIMALQQRGIQNKIFTMGVVANVLEKIEAPYPENIHLVTRLVSEASQFVGSQKLRREFEDDNPTLDYDIAAYFGYDGAGIVFDAIASAREETCSGAVNGKRIAEHLRKTPTKHRKIISSGFLNDTQEIFFHSDGLILIDGKFKRVGIEN